MMMSDRQQQQQPPVQRYYLGEDPFAGSIYGRENKYDGVRPMTTRNSRKQQQQRGVDEDISYYNSNSNNIR